MRRTSVRKLWALAKRRSTPWAPNPWINAPTTLGATPRLESSERPTAYMRPQADDTVATIERSEQDNKQQKVAIRGWENEGGSTAAREA